MIKGSYDYKKLSNMDQVCLCYVLGKNCIDCDITAYTYNDILWEIDESSTGLFKLTPKGIDFLNNAKRQEVMNILFKQENIYNYKQVFEEVFKQSKRCGFKNNIELVLCYNATSIQQAKQDNIIFEKDGELVVDNIGKFRTLDNMAKQIDKNIFLSKVEKKLDKIECLVQKQINDKEM